MNRLHRFLSVLVLCLFFSPLVSATPEALFVGEWNNEPARAEIQWYGNTVNGVLTIGNNRYFFIATAEGDSYHGEANRFDGGESMKFNMQQQQHALTLQLHFPSGDSRAIQLYSSR